MGQELTTGEEDASLASLQSLHGVLSRQLTKMITHGQVVLVEETNEAGDKVQIPVVISPTPAVLNVVRQFLKDNNIQAQIGKNEDLTDLEHALPFNDKPTHAN